MSSSSSADNEPKKVTIQTPEHTPSKGGGTAAPDASTPTSGATTPSKSKLSILQQAAQVVHKEDMEESTEKIKQAAAEIKSVTTAVQPKVEEPTKPTPILKKVDDGMVAKMLIESSHAIQRKENDMLSGNNSKAADRDRYLQRLSSERSLRTGTSRGEGSACSTTSIDTKLSKVSMFINQELDGGSMDPEFLRRSLGSHSQEMLFRSMVSLKAEGKEPRISKKDAYSKLMYIKKLGLQLSRRFSIDDSLNEMLAEISSHKRDLRLREALEKVEALSKPAREGPSGEELKTDPTLRFSLYDDAKECTFKPLVKKNPSMESKNDDADAKGEGNKMVAFNDRQEAKYRGKLQELEFKIGKADYDAKIDKKFCPSCGGKQSYDEIKSKKKVCPQCNVEYKNKISWQSVCNRFFDREKAYAKQSDAARAILAKEWEDHVRKSTERKMYDKKSGKIITIKAEHDAKWDEEMEASFFERMKEYFEKKKGALKAIEEDAYSATLTFKPSVRRRDGEEPDEDVLQIIANFLRRYEEDLEERHTTQPWRFAQKRAPNDLSWKY